MSDKQRVLIRDLTSSYYGTRGTVMRQEDKWMWVRPEGSNHLVRFSKSKILILE